MPSVSSQCGRSIEPAVRVAFARAAVAMVVMLDLALAACGGGSPAAPAAR